MENVNSHSYWLRDTNRKYDQLVKDETVDICIIGGGISGITTAYYLAKEGKNVTVLEKDLIASKTSGNTTGKITSAHNVFYEYLEQSNGEDYAQRYYEANEEAIHEIQNIINEEKIDCDLVVQDNYIYATNKMEAEKLKKEANKVNTFGRDEFVEQTKCPIKINGAIKRKNQAMFNPVKYIHGLCEKIIQNNGRIYENSKVIKVKQNNDRYDVITDKAIIHADKIVMATNYPIVNFPGMYFTKMYQTTSYAVLAQSKNIKIDGMYISSHEPYLSFRKVDDDKILIVGCDHKTGKQEENDNYKILESIIKGIYKDAKIIDKWQTEDTITLDKLPYIGEFSKLWKNAYVITGLKKWGMTTSNVAANIIKDKIINNDNKYSDLFTATRMEPIKNKQEVKNMLTETGSMLVIDKLKKINETIDDIKIGEGKIVNVDGARKAVYREKNDVFYILSPYCAHLGCDLVWNKTAKTWDCPCHGSRYDYKGKVIYAPSVKDI